MPKRRSNKVRSKGLKPCLIMAGLISCAILPAQASWIDTDTICQTYGCVVIHDGVSFDVYDNYDSLSGTTIASGQPLIRRASNPILGTGAVSPVITGTLTESFATAPLLDQGSLLGIDTNRDGVSDLQPFDANNSGFLDAGDSFDVFDITDATDLVGGTTSAQRSFYISSTMAFHMTAQVLTNLGTINLSPVTGLSDMGFSYRVQRAGNDDGMRFGNAAQKGRQYRPLGSISTLADLQGGPVEIMDFRRPIAKKRSNSLPAQSIRFDYVYDFGGYDMSMGNGDLNFEIEFDIQSR